MTRDELEAALSLPNDVFAREQLVRRYYLNASPKSRSQDAARYYAERLKDSLSHVRDVLCVLTGLDHCPRETMLFANSAADLLRPLIPDNAPAVSRLFTAVDSLRSQTQTLRDDHREVEHAAAVLHLGAAVLWGLMRSGPDVLTLEGCDLLPAHVEFARTLSPALSIRATGHPLIEAVTVSVESATKRIGETMSARQR